MRIVARLCKNSDLAAKIDITDNFCELSKRKAFKFFFANACGVVARLSA